MKPVTLFSWEDTCLITASYIDSSLRIREAGIVNALDKFPYKFEKEILVEPESVRDFFLFLRVRYDEEGFLNELKQRFNTNAAYQQIFDLLKENHIPFKESVEDERKWDVKDIVPKDPEPLMVTLYSHDTGEDTGQGYWKREVIVKFKSMDLVIEEQGEGRTWDSPIVAGTTRIIVSDESLWNLMDILGANGRRDLLKVLARQFSSGLCFHEVREFLEAKLIEFRLEED